MDQSGLLGGMNFMPPMNQNGAPDQGQYRRVEEPVNNTAQPRGVFQGQGVRIG